MANVTLAPLTPDDREQFIRDNQEAFNSIKVRYQNEAMQTRLKTFAGFTAQIIQHEIDHCNGIVI